MKPPGSGKSSLDLIDREKAFSLLDVKPNSSFLDLACGVGKYSVALSQVIGDQGVIYAVDLWAEGIATLNDLIKEKNISNIKTFISDISQTIPLEKSFQECH